MKSVFDRIKEAPIGSVLKFRGKKGTVVADEKGAYECWDCIYGDDDNPCLIYTEEGGMRCPCWASEHASRNSVIVKKETPEEK